MTAMDKLVWWCLGKVAESEPGVRRGLRFRFALAGDPHPKRSQRQSTRRVNARRVFILPHINWLWTFTPRPISPAELI